MKTKRQIITIDEEKCDGCGLCVNGCPEGALQLIDGKARLVSDLLCDGLGACIGECPQGAITVETREAEEYDERRVMENMIAKGENTVKAHLHHLQAHGQKKFLAEALAFLKEKNMKNPMEEGKSPCGGGCPGAAAVDFGPDANDNASAGKAPSRLRQWPVQLHLISPAAPYFAGADLLLAADCTAFAMGSFHEDFIKGKALAIACPKLDDGQELYLEKLTGLIDDAKVNTITVATMEVPCCSGLLAMAKKAAAGASRKVPLKHVMISLRGEILKEEWV